MTLLPNSQPRSTICASTRFDRLVRWMRHRIDGGSGGHSHGAEVPLSKLMPWDTEAGDGPRLLEGPLGADFERSRAECKPLPVCLCRQSTRRWPGDLAARGRQSVAARGAVRSGLLSRAANVTGRRIESTYGAIEPRSHGLMLGGGVDGASRQQRCRRS